MNLAVTINQKPTIDIQKIQSKNTSIALKKIIKPKGKKLKEEEQGRTTKTLENK